MILRLYTWSYKGIIPAYTFNISEKISDRRPVTKIKRFIPHRKKKMKGVLKRFNEKNTIVSLN